MNKHLLLALFLLEEEDDDDLLLLALLSSSDDDSSSNDDDDTEEEYVTHKKQIVTNRLHRDTPVDAKRDRTRHKRKVRRRSSKARNTISNGTIACQPLLPIKQEVVIEASRYVDVESGNILIKIEPGNSYDDIHDIEPDRFEMKGEPSSPDLACLLGDDVDVKSETDPFFEEPIEQIQIDEAFMKEETTAAIVGNYLQHESGSDLGEFLSFRKRFSCSVCNEGSVSKVALKRHFDLMHRDTRHFLCADCHLRFMKKADLQSHIELQH